MPAYKRQRTSSAPGGGPIRRSRQDTLTTLMKRYATQRRGRYSSIDKSRGGRASGLYSGQGEGPFSRKLATTLLYRSEPLTQSGSAITGADTVIVGLNDLFDFDFNNDLGNKQPLFYDQLFSAAGPYVRMECLSWRDVITIINTGAEPLSIYWNGHGVAAISTDEDSLSEYTNRPYVQQFHLGAKGSTKDRCTIKSTGKWTDFNTLMQGTAQNYNGPPSTVVYGTLFAKSPSSLTAPTYVMQIDHFFNIVALREDATSS